MVKQTIRIGLVSLLAAALLLGVSVFVDADSSDNAKPVAVVDITIKDDLKLDIAASGPCKVNVRQEGSNTEGMFLSPDGVVYSHASCNDPDAVIDVTISDDLVHIAASGACKLNVRVEGPWEVHIDAGDEVKLNVEVGDESEVFIDDQSLDKPTQNLKEPAGYQESVDNEPSVTYEETGDVTGDVDEHSSRLGSRLPIISGAFLAVGLLAFFLVRRRAKRNMKTKETTE